MNSSSVAMESAASTAYASYSSQLTSQLRAQSVYAASASRQYITVASDAASDATTTVQNVTSSVKQSMNATLNTLTSILHASQFHVSILPSFAFTSFTTSSSTSMQPIMFALQGLIITLIVADVIYRVWQTLSIILLFWNRYTVHHVICMMSHLLILLTHALCVCVCVCVCVCMCFFVCSVVRVCVQSSASITDIRSPLR